MMARFDGIALSRALICQVRILLLGLAIGLALAVPRPAAAGSAVLWQAPVGCPDQGTLRTRVDEQLGRPLAAADQLAARVIITGDPGAFHAQLQIVLGKRVFEREVTGVDCDAVTNAVAIVLAMLVRDAEPSAPAPPPPAPVDVAPVIATARPPGRSPWSASARVGLLGEAGILPAAGAGAAATVAFGRHSWRAEAYGSGWLARRARLVSGSDAGADVSLFALGLRGCATRGPHALCAGGEAGWLEAAAVGVGEPGRATRRFSAAGIGVARWLRLGPHIAAVFMIEGLVALERPRFTLSDDTLVHQPAPLSLRLSIAFQTGTEP